MQLYGSNLVRSLVLKISGLILKQMVVKMKTISGQEYDLPGLKIVGQKMLLSCTSGLPDSILKMPPAALC